MSTTTSMAAGPRARATDPTTSHTAADTTENRVAASQYAVARILEDAGKPLTDTQIAIKARWDYGYRFSDSRLRTARHELAEMGHVKAAGTTKPDGHRSHMILWALA